MLCAADKVVVVPLQMQNSKSEIVGKESILSLSGNGFRPYNHDDTTIIDLNSVGGAVIKRGADPGVKNVMLPISYMSTFSGTEIKLKSLNIEYKSSASGNSISAVILRRTRGSTTSAYHTLIHDTSNYECLAPAGCMEAFTINDNIRILPQLYLTLELTFSSASSSIVIGGVQLVMEHLEKDFCITMCQ